MTPPGVAAKYKAIWQYYTDDTCTLAITDTLGPCWEGEGAGYAGRIDSNVLFCRVNATKFCFFGPVQRVVSLFSIYIICSSQSENMFRCFSGRLKVLSNAIFRLLLGILL